MPVETAMASRAAEKFLIAVSPVSTMKIRPPAGAAKMIKHLAKRGTESLRPSRRRDDGLHDFGFGVGISVHVGPGLPGQSAFRGLIHVAVMSVHPQPVAKDEVAFDFRRSE